MTYDAIIVGAGPAGTTCALALAGSGLSVALLDKATFPRDKICGDAIPGRVFKTLRRINPEWEAEVWALAGSHTVRTTKFTAPNGRSLSANWVLKSYNCPRWTFDAKLFELVSRETETAVYEGFAVKTVERSASGWSIGNAGGKQLSAKLLVAADGANSTVVRLLTGGGIDRKHHAAAVRCYARGVGGLQAGVNEIITLRDYLPGYLWLFPLAGDRVNVGFGMLSREVGRRGINLRSALMRVLRTDPHLAARFAGATLEDRVEGFGLPLGSRFVPLVGDRFMLVGDAGSLIDPFGGHGIDTAMISGRLAAEQVKNSFRKQRFDAGALQSYENAVYGRLRGEFRKNYLAMRALTFWPGALDLAVSALHRRPRPYAL